MPFKSKSQMRKFFAMESAGDLPKGTAHEWAEHTPSIKALPERVKKKKKPSHSAKTAGVNPLTHLYLQMVARMKAAASAPMPQPQQLPSPQPNPAAGVGLPTAQPLPASSQPQGQPMPAGSPTTSQPGGAPAPAAGAPPAPPPPPPPGSFKPSLLAAVAQQQPSLNARRVEMVQGTMVPQVPLPQQPEQIASGQQAQNTSTLLGNTTAKFAGLRNTGLQKPIPFPEVFAKFAYGPNYLQLQALRNMRAQQQMMMQSGWQRQMMMNRSNYPYFPMQQAMSRFQSPGSPSLFTGTGGSSVTGATFGDPRRQNQRPQQRTGPVPPEADSAQPHLFDRVPPRGTGPAWTPRTPAVPQPPTPAQLTSIQEAYQHGLETQQQLANFSQQSLDRVRRASMSPINRNLTLTQLHQQDPRAAMNIWNVLTRNQTTPFNPQSPSANIPLSQVGAQDPRVQGELNSMQLQNPRFQDPSLAGIANNPEYMRLRAAAQGGDNTAQVQLTQLENRYREGNPYRMTAAQLQNDPVFQLHSSMPLSDPLRQRADRIAGLVVNPQQWQQTQAQYQQHFSPTQQAARAGGGQVAQAPTPTAVPADQNFKAPTAATPAPAEETPKPAAPEPPPAATPPATPAATPDFKGVASASPAVASTGSKPETMIPTS